MQAKVIHVLGLGYGDEGKGAMVNYFARKHAPRGPVTVMRANGGAQAGHTVVLRDGRHHTFSQFGSGMFVHGCRTFLSKHMLVNPPALMAEERHLATLGVADACARMAIDGDALVTTRYHIAANRLRELARSGGRHGSCGVGIGETMAYAIKHKEDAPRVRDIGTKGLTWKINALCARLRHDLLDSALPRLSMDDGTVRDEWTVMGGAYDYQADLEFAMQAACARGLRVVDSDHLGNVLLGGGTLIAEGAQGVLLDEDHGFHPYTTWSRCTFTNADELVTRACLEAHVGVESTRVGVLRSYLTRHGAGPLVTEDASMKPSPKEHNRWGDWQQGFRLGHPDLVALRYAADVCGCMDELAITHMDRAQKIKVCTGYDLPQAYAAAFAIGADGHMRAPICIEGQEWLTAAALAAKPRYEPVVAHKGDYDRALFMMLEGAARAPVGYASYGPTAEDVIEV